MRIMNYDEKDQSCHPSRDVSTGQGQIARRGRPRFAEGPGPDIDLGHGGESEASEILDCSYTHVCVSRASRTTNLCLDTQIGISSSVQFTT